MYVTWWYEMRYCKKCVMPDTRPYMKFDEEGSCYPCRNYERKKATDWDARFKELKTICDNYGKDNGSYDCVIAVSRGKDSIFQIYVMKELMDMNPLLVSVSTLFSWADAGRHNFNNMCDAFGRDIISLYLNRRTRACLIKLREIIQPMLIKCHME